MKKLLLFSFLLLALPFIIKPSYAKCASPGPSPRAEGLISGNSITGLDNENGNCITGTSSKVDVKEAQILKLESFDYPSFKDVFYDRSKFKPKSPKDTPLPNAFIKDGLYWFTSDLDINAAPSGNGTEVIFVDGNLNINKAISYPAVEPGGLVFVVKGDINIDPNVIRVDAVLISFGEICTSWDGSFCSRSDKALTINGSLISLAPEDPLNPDITHIHLLRSLASNTQPAEVINAQPKYLKLLTIGDLMDEDLVIPSDSQ